MDCKSSSQNMTSSERRISHAATPKYGNHFDAWNSSATGHQTANNRLSGSTGWRESRSIKLSNQLRSGATGGRRISDFVGAGSEHWDAKTKSLTPGNVKSRAEVSVLDLLISDRHSSTLRKNVSSHQTRANINVFEKEKSGDHLEPSERGIFDGLTIFINGSTAPSISDHRLKYLLAENGARISIHLGRRQVTHVILGNPCGKGAGGAGGGLASSKIQNEIRKTGGCRIKYVTVKWALESLKAGIRLPEVRFANPAVAFERQRSVYSALSSSENRLSRTVEEPVVKV